MGTAAVLGAVDRRAVGPPSAGYLVVAATAVVVAAAAVATAAARYGRRLQAGRKNPKAGVSSPRRPQCRVAGQEPLPSIYASGAHATCGVLVVAVV